MAFGLVLAAGLACGRVRADEPAPAKEAPPPIGTPSSTAPAAPQGWDFSHCTATLADDPDGARDYAEDWRSHGGGLEAEQCAALAQMELGDVATAATALDRLARVPDWPAGPPAGRRGGRESVAETPASRLRRASVAEAAARAWQADDSPKQAFDSATYGLTLAPDDPALKLVYARVAVELGQPQRAIDMLTPLPSTPAARDEALVARAGAWRKLGRIDQGMADINAALHDMPHNGAALLERGILYQRQGQMEQARADWLDVVKQAPDSDEADLARQDLALLETDPEAP
ncbi:tetratricopeptide repeat protein [Komagataeibacter xylinus]|uniref:tetratricopeptide repeat protein n=1 Tax=Komagataeibacter xylinus TaxID=28448 RepID=UPI0010324AB9|nr:tetratricopeptide repeat protein [Komagataeibacter xylinus]